MSDVIENFLSTRLPIGGVAAYSIQLPNAVLASQCFSKSLYPTSTEQMLTRVIQGGRTLLPCEDRAAQYCWTFEAHRVYVAARPDGLNLAFLVENNTSTQLARIKETLQAFLDLPDQRASVTETDTGES
jgi:hypothetical protein